MEYREGSITITQIRYHKRIAEVQDTRQVGEVFFSLLKLWGIIAVAELDPDNGESHVPGIVVHDGFVRIHLRDIFEKTGFSNIHIYTVATLSKMSSKTRELKEFPIFLMTARKAK